MTSFSLSASITVSSLRCLYFLGREACKVFLLTTDDRREAVQRPWNILSTRRQSNKRAGVESTAGRCFRPSFRHCRRQGGVKWSRRRAPNARRSVKHGPETRNGQCACFFPQETPHTRAHFTLKVALSIATDAKRPHFRHFSSSAVALSHGVF